jgi:hypothetical protein
MEELDVIFANRNLGDYSQDNNGQQPTKSWYFAPPRRPIFGVKPA